MTYLQQIRRASTSAQCAKLLAVIQCDTALSYDLRLALLNELNIRIQELSAGVNGVAK